MNKTSPKSKLLIGSARDMLIGASIPPELIEPVIRRLQEGADSYGDLSFDLSPSEVVAEIEQEPLDIIGWWLVLATVDREGAMALYRAGLLEAATAALRVTSGLRLGMYGGAEG